MSEIEGFVARTAYWLDEWCRRKGAQPFGFRLSGPDLDSQVSMARIGIAFSVRRPNGEVLWHGMKARVKEADAEKYIDRLTQFAAERGLTRDAGFPHQ